MHIRTSTYCVFFAVKTEMTNAHAQPIFKVMGYNPGGKQHQQPRTPSDGLPSDVIEKMTQKRVMKFLETQLSADEWNHLAELAGYVADDYSY